MDATDLLVDAVERIRELMHQHGDLDTAVTQRQPAKGSNSIGWLLWHTARVQDAQVAPLIGEPQLWVAEDFARRLGFDPDENDTGYAHTVAQAAAVLIDDLSVLLEYHDAVTGRTIEWLRSSEDADLDRVIDPSFDPPVTVGVRLVSIVADSLEHLGQAGYVRGLLGAPPPG